MSNYVVRERDEAYRFVVSKDLGSDFQGGHWFSDVAHFTHKESAERACQQMNEFGFLYLPGKLNI